LAKIVDLGASENGLGGTQQEVTAYGSDYARTNDFLR